MLGGVGSIKGIFDAVSQQFLAGVPEEVWGGVG